MNQDITFLSDGGDTVRNLQKWISPQSEHVLDWFHVTMKITVMKQMVKGFCEDIQDRFDKQLGSLKWNNWHGNVEKALDRIESFCDDIEYDEKDKRFCRKLDSTIGSLASFCYAIFISGEVAQW